MTVPQSVTYIGDDAFYGSDNLKVIYYPGTKAQWTALNSNINLVLPSGLMGDKAVFVGALANNANLGSVAGGGL